MRPRRWITFYRPYKRKENINKYFIGKNLLITLHFQDFNSYQNILTLISVSMIEVYLAFLQLIQDKSLLFDIDFVQIL